ncbi:hypothetical protein BCE75_11675 [Isoptericola sp. CG 20/1183]|jgi:hypothetical protein|uniref:Uncharacterized protein n=1 Tax=Isoptericola halotolerans TaxID=300560 RepID=A0ABX5EHH9_9MICO|nr:MULTISPECIES: hypothetical protein [Isoptericola]MCK0116750.1 hypothetical protein [Isoptericola sp. S6320L]PRZ02940.1 hypothetical protein BCE75_11675 [Isoptericola sp. CG 20/1183]PRZ09937.1 hypothetical protein BCL65_10175 [Isoptericola halotolerans]
MCRPVTCRTCGKTTWSGCGQHVDDVRRSVPAAQWCGGHDDEAPTGGFLARLFGR